VSGRRSPFAFGRAQASSARVSLAFVACLSKLASGAPASAATIEHDVNRSRVVLDSSACLSVSMSELRRLVALELGDLLAPDPALAPRVPNQTPSPTRNEVALAVTCAGDQATLRAHTADGARALQRAIDLGDFSEGAAPRGLALAGIELLATLDASVRERVGESRPPPAALSPSTVHSMALVGVRRQFMGAAGLGAWGGRVDGLRDRGRLRLHADLEVAATGRTSTSLGQARALLGSVGAFAGARFAPSAHLNWSVTAGARFGVARLEGVPDAQNDAVGSAAWRPWGGPALSARGTVGGPRLAAVVSLEVGYTALGAEALAATTTVLALRGPWLTIAAGAAF